MNDNSFQVYINSVVKLAHTLIVKSVDIANTTNERLRQFLEYETDLERPETWKYYMNLAGEYHPTDTRMFVISSDNLEEIEFNKTNLVRHRNTARDYQFGTRQYGELLAKYPQAGQEDVILGILYPVDMATAIAAPDHKILGYPKDLIEVNEYTLVEELQDWIRIYYKRYYNEQYTISDSLYFGVALTMCRMNMVPAIMTLRKKRHKTIEAHSYYVSQYLASNSKLGEAYQFMTLEQSMHFYRNIRYYQRHAGMNQTLDKLVDALLTARRLPMASYSMRHDITNQVENIYPAVTFRRVDMTDIPSAGVPEYIDTLDLLKKEIPDAPDNDEEVSINKEVIEQYLKDSPGNVVQTKLLESAMIDYAGARTYKLHDIQIAHWLYYSYHGFYKAVVNVANPRTNERIVLTVKEAYILATYCLYRSMDVIPVEIPLLGAQRVQRYPLPDDADLKSVVDMNYVSDFSWNEAHRYVREVEEMISIDAFYDKSKEVYESANHQRNLVAYQEGMHHRGEVYKLISRYWGDAYIRIVPEGTTYDEWIHERNLDFDKLNRLQFEQLFTNLVSAATGANLATSQSLRNIQRAMTKALKDLSSYTIQVVTKMSDEETIMTDFPSVRVGDQNVSAGGSYHVRVGDYDVAWQNVSGVGYGELPINIFTDVIRHDAWGKTGHYIDLQNGPHMPERGARYKHQCRLSDVSFSVVKKPNVAGTGLQPVLGMDLYMAMTPEQKASLFEQ